MARRADGARPDRGGARRLLRRASGRRHASQGRRSRFLAARPAGPRARAARGRAGARAGAGPVGLVDFERYRVQGARTCFYSVAEGERFIVEPMGLAWVLAGFSGHGFKFGAVIGEAIAEALIGRRPAGAVSAWAAGQ